MKGKSTLIFAVLVAGLIASCKKDQKGNLPVVQISRADSGKTTTLSQGQSLKISLGNPGDGGYTFDQPKYDPSVLKLNSHSHVSPANNMLIEILELIAGFLHL